MKKLLAITALSFLFSCNNEKTQPEPSPGILENTEQTNTTDTGALITDSVVLKDSNTADIEPMKKIN